MGASPLQQVAENGRSPGGPAARQDDTALRVTLLALVFFTCALVAMFLPILFLDGDTWWHLAAGRHIIEHRTALTVDPFSYTLRDRPWVAHEWLAESLMYATFSTLGWAGLAALFGLSFGATITALAAQAMRWLTPLAAAGTALLVAACLVTRLFARPHMFAWLVLALWMLVLLRARERNRSPNIAWALLIMLWANLHASYVVGLAIAGVFGLEALIEAPADRRWTVLRAWARFGLACLIAAMATPSGARGILFPFTVSNMAALDNVGEWKPTSFAGFGPFEAAVILAIFACLYRAVRVPPLRLLLVLATLHMALVHMRHQEICLIAAGMVLCEPLGRAYRSGALLPSAGVGAGIRAAPAACGPVVGVGAAMLVALTAARLGIPIVREESGISPFTALAQVPAELRAQRVFNGYGPSGLLIYMNVPVYFDGRVDLYGDRFAQDYFAIEARGDTTGWLEADRRWHFCWTILGPAKPITHWLDAQPNWTRLYADRWAVIHVRRDDAQCRGPQR